MSSLLGSESILVGSGWGVALPDQTVRTPDPRREYMPIRPGQMSPKIPMSLPRGFDDVTRPFGHRVYEAMLTDPAVASSFLSLKFGILDGGMQLMPALPSANLTRRRRAPQVRDEAGTVKSLTPEESLALEVTEFCERAVCRLPDFPTVLLQLLDAMAFGVKLAEVTNEVVDDGPDKGKLVFQSIKVKPWWAWQFVVDAWLNVRGILTSIPQEGGFLLLGPDKFAVHTWLPQNNDPRGTSILRAAYAAWNLKIQTLPLCYQHLVRWGSPGLDFEMTEGDTTPRIPTDINGRTVPGAEPLDPVAYHTQNLIAYQGGAVLVHPAGSKVNAIEPKSPGEAFWLAFDWLDRQIVLAINLAARATLEAKNGSKADSQTAQDEKGLVKSYGRQSLSATVRGQILKPLVLLNYGKAVADLYTPLVSFGKAEHQDRPALWTAVASLQSSGYLGDSQKPELDAEVGLPVRDAEADAKAAAERASLSPKGDKPQGEQPDGQDAQAGDGQQDQQEAN